MTYEKLHGELVSLFLKLREDGLTTSNEIIENAVTSAERDADRSRRQALDSYHRMNSIDQYGLKLVLERRNQLKLLPVGHQSMDYITLDLDHLGAHQIPMSKDTYRDIVAECKRTRDVRILGDLLKMPVTSDTQPYLSELRGTSYKSTFYNLVGDLMKTAKECLRSCLEDVSVLDLLETLPDHKYLGLDHHGWRMRLDYYSDTTSELNKNPIYSKAGKLLGPDHVHPGTTYVDYPEVPNINPHDISKYQRALIEKYRGKG